MIPIWIYGVVALVLVSMGFAGGWKTESAFRDAAQLKAERTAVKQVEAEATKQASASQTLEDKKEQTRVVYRTITQKVDRIVVRPVYRNACFDDDGLRNANAALQRKAADPGQPDGALPGPVPAH